MDKKLDAARLLRFPFTPKGASLANYDLKDSEDQHQIWLPRGLPRSHPKALIALHGQPRKNQAPRTYEFPRVVRDVVETMIASGDIEPFVLLLPHFRFTGQNWPMFSLAEFLDAANKVLEHEQIVLAHPFVVGHSGAAGCGGEGLNRAHEFAPSAVAFFDTCLGTGFIEEALALAAAQTPTVIIHSVETAGFHPRQPTEYLSTFDFGKVYARIGLRPVTCQEPLPDVPLRRLKYRCAASENNAVRAFVVDTGEGEAAHNAVVSVGLRYFLKQYFANPTRSP